MFTCFRHRRRLGAYLDGELSGRDRTSLERHLGACASCRALLSGLEGTEQLLAPLDVPPVPPGLADRITAAARDRGREAATAGWNPLLWWRTTSPPLRRVAIGIPVAGLIAGLLLGWTSPPPGERAAVGAQPDPLAVYRIDYLGDSPAGSLADSYMQLVAAGDEGGR